MECVTYVSEQLLPLSPVCTLRERVGVRVFSKQSTNSYGTGTGLKV